MTRLRGRTRSIVVAVAAVATACSASDDRSQAPSFTVAPDVAVEPVDDDPAPSADVSVGLPPPVDLAPAADFALGDPLLPSADDPDSSPLADVLARLPDLSGETISVLGPETGDAAESFEATFAAFEAATGADVVYDGRTDDTSRLADLLAEGAPPDLVVVAQPGRLLDLAAAGDALAVPDVIVDAVRADFDGFWTSLVTSRRRVFGVPNKASVKSLVWYSPDEFEAEGYAVPDTFDDLRRLETTMRRDGRSPWCVGISSGDASGWPFTDWVEDVVLRLHGVEVYDEWVRGDIAFSDQRIVEAVDLVSDTWFEPGNVAGGRRQIPRITFEAAALGVLDGSCLMHRQASFIAGLYRAQAATIGPDGDVDVFEFPPIDGAAGQAVLGAGDYLAAFTDRDATWAALAYFASPVYADARVSSGAGGFFSANRSADPTLHDGVFEREVAELLVGDAPVRFDASDLLATSVNAEFWRSATAYVNGSIDARAMLDRIEATRARTG